MVTNPPFLPRKGVVQPGHAIGSRDVVKVAVELLILTGFPKRQRPPILCSGIQVTQ